MVRIVDPTGVAGTRANGQLRTHGNLGDPIVIHVEHRKESVVATFPKYRKEMKGLHWGEFYNQLPQWYRFND